MKTSVINKKIFLIRHGETNLNAKGVCQGRINEPINENGFKQAEKSVNFLVSYIKKNNLDLPERIFSSPLLRTKQTTNIFKETLNTPLQISYDERLLERNFGDIESLHFDVIRKDYNHALDVLTLGRIADDNAYKNKIENNEDIFAALEPRVEVEKRFLSIIEDAVKGDKSDKPLLFISHGAAIAAVSHTLITGEYEEIIATSCMGNCHIAVFNVQCYEGKFSFSCDGYDLGNW